MSSYVDQRLSPELFDYLQMHHPFVVTTIDEDADPWAEMGSWIQAFDASTIRLVTGSRRRSVENIRGGRTVALQIQGT
jgi:hypothetical protein